MMNDCEKELREKWEAVGSQAGGSLQLSVDHPLPWFVRSESSDMKSIATVCGRNVSISSSKVIDAACRQRRSDGKYAVVLTLKDRDYEDVFITMAGDIIQYSRADNPDKSVSKLVKRYNEWRRMFDRRSSELLSLDAQKGLIGELLFLKERIETGMTPSDALDGWLGPEGADQDFTYEDGWHEIKTTGIAADAVTISSIEQLDNGNPGELVVYRVDRCAPAATGAFTLRGLVKTLSALISEKDGDAVFPFMQKLYGIGYSESPEYDSVHFESRSKQSYGIDASFPRLRRQDIPPEITGTQYQINLPSINDRLK